MDVLIATDGSMDPNRAAEYATALAGDDGKVTVTTIVRVPRTLVSDLRSTFGDTPTPVVEIDAEYAGSQVAEGGTPQGWPGDDAVIAQYLGDKRVERCRPIVEAIRAAGGTAESTVKEGHEVEDDLMEMASQLDVGAMIVGSHGHGAFQGLLGSTGAKLVRRAPCPVLVLR